MAQDIRVALTLDNKQFNTALKQSEKNVKGLGTKTANTTSSVTGLVGAFQAFIALGAVRELVQLVDEFTTLNNRLKAVTNSEKEAASALKLVQQVASETRSDLSAVAGLFADITIASEELGLSQERVAGIAKVFSQSLKVSGADAGTAAGAIRQFGQALASGVLRGDEFNSINEANSKFMGELAKAVGVTRGELREMAQQGKITAQVMIDATEKMAGDVETAFGKTVMTIGDSFTNLRNVIVGSVGEVGEVSGAPTLLADAINDLAKAIQALQPVINIITTIATALGTLVALGAQVFFVNKILGSFGDSIFLSNKKSIGFKATIAGIIPGLKKMGKEGSIFAKVTTGIAKALSSLKNLMKNAFTFRGLKTVQAGIDRLYVSMTKGIGVVMTTKLVFQGLAAIALAVVRKLFAFTIIFDVIKLVMKAVAGLVDAFGRFFNLDFGLLEKVNKLFDFIGNSLFAVAKNLVVAGAGFLGFGKDTEKAKVKIDDATLALNAFNTKLKDVRNNLGKGFLENEKADKYATDWEKATKRVKTATDAIAVYQQGIANATLPDDFIGPPTKELSELQEELGGVTKEFNQADQALKKLEKGFNDSFTAIQDALADGLGVKGLEIENFEFGFSDLEKNIRAEIRKATKVTEEETKRLTDLIANPDIPDSIKEKWITALSAIPNSLEVTKSEIRRLMTELFDKEELKEAGEEAAKALADVNKEIADKLAGSTKALGDFQAQLANANTPADLENLRERLAELGRTGVIFGDDMKVAEDAFKKAFASLGATDGIKLAIEDIAESMTPFQMAVDATTMVWGKMGSAIDDMVDNGKSSFSDLADSILKDLAKMIIKAYLFKLIVGGGKALGFDMSFLEKKATGGPVAGGKPYMVGEEGPELFVPGKSGTIVPNNALGGGGGPVTNNYITNNINALDSRSVAQVFAENRQTLLGTVEYARKETSYGV
jgi:tape measure domain-containing protein